MQDIPSELCAAWPKGWDEDVALVCLTKRTLLDTALRGYLSPSGILLGRKPLPTLDTFVPRVDNTELIGGLDAFLKERRKMPRVVRQALKKKRRY